MGHSYRLLGLSIVLVVLFASNAVAAAATTTQLVGPIGRHFRLRRSLHVAGPTVAATCSPGSETIGAAYRCFAGHSIYDPCWPGRDRSGFVRFYCLLRPWDRDVRRLFVSDFEIVPASLRAERQSPWGIQLASGQRCVASPGANDSVEGVGVLWWCSNTLSLLADLDRSTDPWTVTEVERSEALGTYTSLGRQQIGRAWFGKRAATP